jgi:hypothetical protein
MVEIFPGAFDEPIFETAWCVLAAAGDDELRQSFGIVHCADNGTSAVRAGEDDTVHAPSERHRHAVYDRLRPRQIAQLLTHPVDIAIDKEARLIEPAARWYRQDNGTASLTDSQREASGARVAANLNWRAQTMNSDPSL